MRRVKKIRLRSIIGFFFICFVLAYANSYAAGSGGKSQGVSFEVLNPEAERIMPSEISVISPRVEDLSRKNIGLIWIGKSGGEYFFDALEVILKKKYPLARVSRYTRGVNNAEKKILEEVDAFINGVGDSGMGAFDSVAGTIKYEKLGKPGVAVFGEHLMYNAREAANQLGMPSVRMVPLPSMEFYTNRFSADSMMPCAEAVLDDLIDALTRPVQDTEKHAGSAPEKTVTETVRITSDNMESAYEKFYQFYMDNDWGDGLPLIPPTQHNVEKMLRSTSLSPDTVLGEVFSMGNKIATATLKKVAINAVMAGAKPEYFPVIVAAMQGILDRGFSHHIFTSDGSFNLFIAVSGPIAKKINMNSGVGLFGHGWRANNTIGRAVRLCMNNIAHIKPGKLDTALTGRANSHTFYVLAENDESSPWEPYHTLWGYKAEDSYVTVSGIGLGGGIGWGGDFSGYGGGTGIASNPEKDLQSIIDSISANRIMFSSYSPGIGTGAMSRPFNYIFVLSPGMAYQLNKMGFTRQSLHNYLIDKSSVPYEALSDAEIEGLKRRLSEKTTAYGGTDNIPEDRIPVFRENLKPGGKIPVVVSPDNLNIFVAGEASGYNFGALYLLGAHQIKRVQ